MASFTKSKAKTALVWFSQNDLRLLDHEPLTRAHELYEKVLHVFVFDDRQCKGQLGWYDKNHPLPDLDLNKFSPRRATFLLENVVGLKKSLQEQGSNLYVCEGLAEQKLVELCKKVGGCDVFCHTPIGFNEQKQLKLVKRSLSGEGFKLHSTWGGSTLYHVDDVDKVLAESRGGFPRTFTQFRNLCERNLKVRKFLPVPSKIKPCPELEYKDMFHDMMGLTLESVTKPDQRAAVKFNGGESEALKRVKTWIWDQDLLRTYKDTRNGMVGEDYSSKFSAYLSHGSISPRYIHAQCRKYERERIKNNSTYWLVFELLWRDYFRYYGMEYGSRLFFVGGVSEKKLSWGKNLGLFNKWVEGKTNVPLVDANMIELRNTGFMSNRGRQIVASFLTKDLKLDWRLGAMYFEHALIDHDVNSNYGNWQYVAGVGSDPRENRYFNPVTQAKKYDTNCEYIKLWLPKLKNLNNQDLHDPFSSSSPLSPIVQMKKWSSNRKGNNNSKNKNGKRGGNRGKNRKKNNQGGSTQNNRSQSKGTRGGTHKKRTQ